MTGSPHSLRSRITDNMKSYMREKKQKELGIIRLLLAEIKQIEVDQRVELTRDEQIIPVIDKMLKQRQQSITQFKAGGRDDLVEQETFEVDLLKQYLPAQLSAEEIQTLIEEAVSQTGASDIKDMGAVMGILKPKLQGRADLGAVGQQIKQRLTP